ncbi:hypothetical protein X874_13020 [Mannheimia varigena USDA-ARS-USMARC-1312]|nr:hypothetical protein X874_13020 [Mannheimia varigena USDA-ARS-USMARC-1312]
MAAFYKDLVYILFRVSTHSHAEVAAGEQIKQPKTYDVSTHSHAEVAAKLKI